MKNLGTIVTSDAVPVMPTVWLPDGMIGKLPDMLPFLFSDASLYALIVSQSMFI